MTPQQGQNLVLLSGATVAGVETLKSLLAGNGFPTRELVGAGIAFTVLAGVSEVAPGPAGLLAATVMVTVVIVDAGPVITGLLGSTKPPPKGSPHGKHG